MTYSSPYRGETEQTQTETAFYEIFLCTVICFNQDDFNLSPTLTCEAATAAAQPLQTPGNAKSGRQEEFTAEKVGILLRRQ